MKALTVSLPTNQTVLIQVADQPELVGISRTGGTTASTGTAVKYLERLEEIGTTIGDVCSSLHAKAATALAANKPKELSLEFGITLAGEAGIPLVTNGSVEAAFKVSVKWEFK